MYWDHYYVPQTVTEALAVLAENSGTARIIAGGTDLMLQIRESKLKVSTLVDLSEIKDLACINEAGGWIEIGALTTHTQLAASPLIRTKARVLADAAASVGSPQIRNVGTIGGNVISAQPAADTTIALLVLDARVRFLNQDGEQVKPIREIFLGPGKSLIDPSREVVTAFEFKATAENEATAFMRHAKRKALALPIVNLGVWIKTDPARSRFEDARIALGPMAPVPYRAENAEKVLIGAPCKASVIQEAMEVLAGEVTPRDSIRGGAVYKREMAKVMLKRAVASALESLGGAVANE